MNYRNVASAEQVLDILGVENQIVFDATFLRRAGGIANDTRALISSLKPDCYKLWNYQETSDDKDIGRYNERIVNLMSLIGKPLKTPTDLSSCNIWFSQFTSWNIRNKKKFDIIRVHDLFPLTNPEWFPYLTSRLFKKRIDNFNKDTHFVANSKHTAETLCQILKIDHNRVFLLPCTIVEREVSMCRSCDGCRLETPKAFAIAVGTIEPRKNYQQLLDFWTSLDQKVLLIIVGRYGWKMDYFQTQVASLPFVKWLENVCDGALTGLYKNALVFISNSLDEGFNMPASEARLLGKPILLSDIAVHREFHSDFAAFFSDSSSFQSQLKQVLV